ncbi:MAG TPA: HEAT repeat domain-containing protein [Gemmatimonadaceae bacterium]|jgi:HEAT repeat protein|nr:HEAT repeat domain-containing protein [Gemmatimonadaceae bacterium]
MRYLLIGVACLVLARDAAASAAPSVTFASDLPAPSWAPQDPADSLYREARRALSDANYQRAAELFARLRDRFPRSTYAADSYYWQAFALNRNDRLQQALALLDEQGKRFPNATTRRDAQALATRIRGELARRGDANEAERLTSVAATSCPEEEDDVRIAAINGLMQMDAERAMPILKKVLARGGACSAELRRKAVFVVSQQRSAEAADILLNAAQNDPDGEVRQQAVFWLGQVRDERAVDMLTEVLTKSNDAELKEKAIFALSQHRSPRAFALLRSYAERDGVSSALREKAIFWIGQHRGQENADFLKGLYGKLDDAELKEKVIFSLSQQRGFGNDKWLMDIAVNESEDTELRKKALFWAGQMREVALDQLIGLYDRMKAREMREQLIFVYSQRRDTEAVNKLMSIAKSDPDRELRKKAVFWLSQSRDPRAAQFLLEIIEQ